MARNSPTFVMLTCEWFPSMRIKRGNSYRNLIVKRLQLSEQVSTWPKVSLETQQRNQITQLPSSPTRAPLTPTPVEKTAFELIKNEQSLPRRKTRCCSIPNTTTVTRKTNFCRLFCIKIMFQRHFNRKFPFKCCVLCLLARSVKKDIVCPSK